MIRIGVFCGGEEGGRGTSKKFSVSSHSVSGKAANLVTVENMFNTCLGVLVLLIFCPFFF